MNSTPHADGSAAVELVLGRPGVRRAAGLPTVSVLVGPVGTALGAFRAWVGRHGHPLRAGAATEVAGIVALFARCAEEARNLVADAYSHLATHTGRPVAELRAALADATGRDLDLFFTANDGRLPTSPGTRLARALCEAPLLGERARATWWTRTGAEPLADLAGLAELTAAGGAPACVLAWA